MKFYAYGDVHQRVDAAQRFLDHAKPEKVIWLGDFLDSLDDSPFDCIKTALWLKKTMVERPDDVFIQSNHDLAYRFPETDKYKICGWTPAKHAAFTEFFPKENWGRFVIYHYEEWNGHKLLFSHAGLHSMFFPFGRFSLEHLRAMSAMALANGNKEPYNPLLDNDSGPMWLRWQRFPLLDDVCQIVGHTTFGEPQIRATNRQPNWNLCLDCAHTYYAVFKEKNVFAVNRHKGFQHRLQFTV